MTLNDRFKEVHKYVGGTLEQFGRPIGLSKQQVWNIEHDQNGVTPEIIQSVHDHYGIDVRWFFGEITSIKAADMALREEDPSKTLEERLMEEVRRQRSDIAKLQQIVHPTESVDELTQKSMSRPELRKLIATIHNLDDDDLKLIGAYARGLSDMKDVAIGSRESQEATA